MSQTPEMPLNATAPSSTTCANCHSMMPAGLRFCRNCGFRLGEGLAEYTQTVRFDGTTVPATAQSTGVATKPRKRSGMSGMSWIFIGLFLFFICAAAFTAVVTPIRHAARIQFTAPVAPKSYIGVDGLDGTDGGVTFENINCPGGPADKAGLVGGDVITSFDGQAVNDEDQLSDLLTRTPIGKTVDVTFIRDGETKTTKLTTVSQDESKRLATAANKRPEGRGQFGYEEGAAEREAIPNTKMFGVKLGKILTSRPADLAGIKEGDIVVEFDKVPIRTPEEFLWRVHQALPYSTVTVVVFRDGQKMEIPVKIGRG